MAGNRKAGIVVVALVVGGVFLWTRRANAKPKPRPSFDDGDGFDDGEDGGEGIDPDTPGGFDPSTNELPNQPQLDPYVPSEKTCDLSGKSYNAAKWDSPEQVAGGLRALGYDIPVQEAAAFGLTSSQGRAEIKQFQKDSMQLGLHPQAGPAWLDGKMGACSLVALDGAFHRLKIGTWQKP